MIVFEKKPDLPKAPAAAVPAPAPVAAPEPNRFESIRKKAGERNKKSDTDGTRRRDKQTADDNRLL